jgi:hypothetical protein
MGIYTGDAFSAINLQGGLVRFWKLSAWRYNAKGKWIKDAFEKNAPPSDASLNRLEEWFASRCYPLTQIEDYIDEDNETGKWAQFRMIGGATKDENEPRRYHGTFGYALHCILHSKSFVASSAINLGHDFHSKAKGVYTSRNLSNSLWYARPCNLFGDYGFYRFVFLVSGQGKPEKDYQSEGFQEVWKSTHLSIVGLLVKVNDFNWAGGTEVTVNWSPWFEAHPHRLLQILEADICLEEALADLKSPESTLPDGHAQPRSSSSSSSQNHTQAERELCKEQGKVELERQRTVIREHCSSVRSIQACQAEQKVFIEAFLDMKGSLYNKKSHWEPNFSALLEGIPRNIRLVLQRVTLKPLADKHLYDEEVSIKWEPTVQHMRDATANYVLYQGKRGVWLREMGNWLLGLLSRALNEFYGKQSLARSWECVVFCDMFNCLATERHMEIRAYPHIQLQKKTISKVEVRARMADPEAKYTTSRRRDYYDPQRREWVPSFSAAVTQVQKHNKRRKVAINHEIALEKAMANVDPKFARKK